MSVKDNNPPVEGAIAISSAESYDDGLIRGSKTSFPGPSTWMPLAAGLLGMVCLRRRIVFQKPTLLINGM
jgi:hypothetical protein